MITERGRALAARPRVSTLPVPNISEIDFGALRADASPGSRPR